MNRTTTPPELRRTPPDDERHSRHWWIWTTDDAQRHLHDWPLLRHLMFERRFRYAWLACTFIFLLFVLGLPPVWIVSPRGFTPVVRVSWLSMIEARVYAALARKTEAADERERAYFYWRSAVSFNIADAPVLRSALSNVMHLPARNAMRFADARWNSSWLLHLTHTNSADLDLVSDVYRHFGTEELLYPLITGNPQPYSDHLKLSLLKARLQSGEKAAFLTARSNLPPAVAATDPELPVYDAAAQIIWGEPSRVAAAQAVLASYQTPEHAGQRVRALRLQLLAGIIRRIPEEVAPALSRLRDLHEDYPLEHAAYWQLLQARGRTEEARQLASQFADPPITSSEVTRISDTFLRLGLTDQAIQFLEHFAPSLGSTSRIWLTYADLLIQRQSWDDLRGLALEIRKNDLSRGLLGGYSHYLEGLAEISTHHTNEAAIAFAKVAQDSIHEPEVVLWVARDLLKMENYKPALDLLRAHEGELQLRIEYWQALVRAAYHEHDADLLLDAAQHQFKLAPERLDSMNDLAAALLIFRRDPEQALALTRQVLEANPTSLAARINQALALLQHGNPGAAKPLLLSIDTERLQDIERTMLAFAETDLYRQEHKTRLALEAAGRVNTAHLLPPQIAWLDQVRASLQDHAAD